MLCFTRVSVVLCSCCPVLHSCYVVMCRVVLVLCRVVLVLCCTHVAWCCVVFFLLKNSLEACFLLWAINFYYTIFMFLQIVFTKWEQNHRCHLFKGFKMSGYPSSHKQNMRKFDIITPFTVWDMRTLDVWNVCLQKFRSNRICY